MTTYSTSLKLALINDGGEVGLWGQTTNTNLGTLLEQAITGTTSINMADANVTLTSLNGATDQARNQVLILTGTNNAVRDVIPPVVKKTYIVVNNTTGGYAVRVIGSSGTGVLVPNGTTSLIYCNGTSFFEAINSNTITGAASISGALSVGGATSLGAALTYGGVTLSNAVTGTGSMVLSASPALTGTPTAPTAANGTNTTQIATTAFVNSAVTSATGSLGTMSIQNANAVAITGGTVNGVSGSNPSLTVGTATNATTATNASQFQGLSKLGLGITGETWQNTTGSRSFNVTYTNSRTYPIQVAMSLNLPAGGGYDIICNGVAVGRDANTANVRTNCSFIVPAGGTYSVNGTGSIFYWNELY